jgi:hypothetical protein
MLVAVLQVPLMSGEQVAPVVPHWLLFVHDSMQMYPLPLLLLWQKPAGHEPLRPQSYASPSSGLQTNGPTGWLFVSVMGAQHPFVAPA